MPGIAKNNRRYLKRKRTERMLAVLALVLIAIVWVIGSLRAEADLLPAVIGAIPETHHVSRVDDDLYQAWGDEAEQNLLGYVALGKANGYGGEMIVAVGVDQNGNILGVVIADHKETPAWMSRVEHGNLLESLIGKSYSDPFQIGEDVDGITGATYTSKAVATAVLNGSRLVARYLTLPLKTPPPPRVQFGVPEIVLILLFAVGYVGHQRGFSYKKQVRWGSMLTGLIVLGFIYNSPLTLAYIVKLLLGYFPQWQTNLYWYFLIGGIIFVFSVDNKNPYCEWFCPFGAAQECMAVIGGAKVYRPNHFYLYLQWLQRFLALGAILLGVYYRSPGLASYELFGTLFGLVGSSLQFIALGLVLIVALFIKRPWCNYLCPLRPVVEIIRIFREWVIEIWQKNVHRTRKTTTF